MITIPQIRSVGLSVVAILVVSACLGISNAFLHGEIREWKDLGEAASDSLLFAVGITVGWIALKSPLAKEVKSLLSQESVKVTESPEGAKVTETKKTTVQVETTGEKAEPPNK